MWKVDRFLKKHQTEIDRFKKDYARNGELHVSSFTGHGGSMVIAGELKSLEAARNFKEEFEALNPPTDICWSLHIFENDEEIGSLLHGKIEIYVKKKKIEEPPRKRKNEKISDDSLCSSQKSKVNKLCI